MTRPVGEGMELHWNRGTRLVAIPAGLAFRLLPRRFRFRAALALARLTAPLAVAILSRAGYGGVMRGRVDATLRVLCRAMIGAGTCFDPEVRYDGPDDLSGALLISGHFPLNALATRHMFDRGTPPTIVKRFPLSDPFYWGSLVRDEVLEASPTVLIKVRSALARGRPVFVNVDSTDPMRRGTSVTTIYGVRHVSPAIFDFARRCDVPLYFFCARSERASLPLVFIRRIEPDVEAFLAHYREQSDQIV